MRPWKAAVEGDELVALGVILRQLDRGFDALRRRNCRSKRASASLPGAIDGELLGELRHAFVIKIGAGHVDQFGGLLLNGGDNFGMAMAGGADGDAGGKIEKHVAVNVFDHRAAAALGDQRIIARVGRRHELRRRVRRCCFGFGSGQIR